MLYAYPGFMSFDSVVQLREARAGHYTDWHPPVMAWLWHVIEHMPGPAPLGMLLLQSGLLLVGTYALVRHVAGPMASACAAVAILLFPPIATTMAVIWKDSLMVGAVVAGTALVLSASRRRRVAGLALFALAAAVRYNGLTVTMVPVIALFRWSDTSAGWRRYAIASGVWLATVAVALVANKALTDEVTHPWHSSIAMFDIVGTLRFAPALSDAELAETLQGTPLVATHDLQQAAREAYDPEAGVFRIVETFMKQPTTADERAAIARAWERLVVAHPVAYLRHRWRVFRRVLVLQPTVHPWIWVGIDLVGDDLLELSPPRFQRSLMNAALRFATSWFMRVYIYGALVLAAFGLALWRRDRLVLAITTSAIISELALLVLAPTEDFRYSLWLVVAALLAAFLLAAQLVRARSAGQPGHASA